MVKQGTHNSLSVGSTPTSPTIIEVIMEIKELTDSDFARIMGDGFKAAKEGKQINDNPYLNVQGDYWWTTGYTLGLIDINTNG